jgi:capsular polysaccharide biosynthesis protein
MAQTFNVLVDVKVKVNVPITVNADNRKQACEIANQMGLAMFKAKYPELSNVAYLVETDATGIMG